MVHSGKQPSIQVYRVTSAKIIDKIFTIEYAYNALGCCYLGAHTQLSCKLPFTQYPVLVEAVSIVYSLCSLHPTVAKPTNSPLMLWRQSSPVVG